MKVDQLIPLAERGVPFRLSHLRNVPEVKGCYVLSAQSKEVLYAGLTVNLHRRFQEHIESPDKNQLTDAGRAVWFHWHEAADLELVERSWLNLALATDGRLPRLNKIYSPTSV